MSKILTVAVPLQKLQALQRKQIREQKKQKQHRSGWLRTIAPNPPASKKSLGADRAKVTCDLAKTNGHLSRRAQGGGHQVTISKFATIILLAAALPGCVPNHKLRLAGFKVSATPVPSTAFWAGADREELTPPPGFPNAGHGPPAATARGYWSRLYARAFYFRDPHGNVAVLVSCDLWAMSAGLWHAVLQKVNGSGIYLPPESLVISATHTHQSPGAFMTASAYNLLASNAPGFSEDLFNHYADTIALAIRKAAASPQPAHLVLRQGKANIQRNRAIVPFFKNSSAADIMRDSQVSCAEDDGICARLKAVDNTLTALESVDAATGAPIGLMVFYAVHPTALRHDSPLVSSDLVGRAMSRLEPNAFAMPRGPHLSEKVWPVAGFFQGAEGDTSPNWKEQRREDVLGLGDELARRVRTLPESLIPDADLGIDARRMEFPNDWHHERPNDGSLGPKFAAKPTPGAALFGGAEDGRAGILYQQHWRGGIKNRAPGCETRSDQGCKIPAVDQPLSDFLRTYGLQKFWYSLPARVRLTGLVAANAFPKNIPVGWLKFGNSISLAVLPVEMTNAMARRLRESIPDRRVVVMGLCNEYYSYTTTEEEYADQQYEGASTLSGPKEGAALIEMLHEVEACKDGTCRTNVIPAVKYGVGFYPPRPFGPEYLRPPHNMVDEDMDAIAPRNLAYSESRVPRAEWTEASGADWSAADRSVRVFRVSDTSQAVDDEYSWNFLTVLKDSSSDSRTWNALWMIPKELSRDSEYYFRVTIPKKGDLCSAPFRPNNIPDRVPVQSAAVDRPCPAR
jgi:neutral ceramidase